MESPLQSKRSSPQSAQGFVFGPEPYGEQRWDRVKKAFGCFGWLSSDQENSGRTRRSQWGWSHRMALDPWDGLYLLQFLGKEKYTDEKLGMPTDGYMDCKSWVLLPSFFLLIMAFYLMPHWPFELCHGWPLSWTCWIADSCMSRASVGRGLDLFTLPPLRKTITARDKLANSSTKLMVSRGYSRSVESSRPL